MIVALAIASTLLFAACAAPQTELPIVALAEAPALADEARELGWQLLGGEGPAPSVTWTVDCVPVDDGCYGGAHLNGDVVVMRMNYPWNSALVHEMLHYRFWLDGDSDNRHESCEWGDIAAFNAQIAEALSDGDGPVAKQGGGAQ